MDIDAIQKVLQVENLDGWLLYDFFGSNPIARSILGLNEFTTRRWLLFIPRAGKASAILPALEVSQFESCKFEDVLVYRTWNELHDAISKIVPKNAKIAMEYSAENAIPYISRVDKGTIELIEKLTSGKIVSSSKLVQYFQSRWGEKGLESHKKATDIVYRYVGECFEAVKKALTNNKTITEYDLQKLILDGFKKDGIVTNSECIVSIGQNTGKPHYAPSKSKNAQIKRENVLLVDVWGKLNTTGAVYTDMTFMAYLGGTPPKKVEEVWDIVRKARDTGIEFITNNFGKRPLCGFEVDDVVRKVIRDSGYGEYFIHRTGHSIQHEDHANGVNLDNFETHDDREIIKDIGFSIEPGIYLPEFGMRSEVVMYIDPKDGPVVTTPLQNDLILIF